MWDFKNADFNGYGQDLLDIDWNLCLTVDSIDQICSAWTDKILELAKTRIPNKIVKIRSNCNIFTCDQMLFINMPTWYYYDSLGLIYYDRNYNRK